MGQLAPYPQREGSSEAQGVPEAKARGASHLRDSNERPWNAPGHHPAGRQLLMTLQEKGSRTLSPPGADFLSARGGGWGVSNVRSPPPGVPSEGQASHFPFRKGQSKRPGEAHQEEMEGGGPGLALPAGVGALA